MVHYPMGMYHPNGLQPGVPSPFSDPAGYQVPNAPYTAAAPISRTPLNIPTIKEWLQYCGNHPSRSGPVLLPSLCDTLEQKGILQINQLEGSGIDVEKIITWTSVMPGIALLLYRYAKEDMALIHAGQFSMESPVTGAS